MTGVVVAVLAGVFETAKHNQALTLAHIERVGGFGIAAAVLAWCSRWVWDRTNPRLGSRSNTP